ncbi:disease resistance protein RGA2-like [Triticum urartu]|nr:disease resistance protein RGA2-like [Triticum urartu]
MEEGVGWLALAILASPLIDKHDPWVSEAGLAEEIDGLKSEIKGVHMVVSAVKGRALGNEALAGSLVHLKEVLYDARNLVDDLDYYRLQQGKPASIEPTSSSHGKRLRSKAWDHFVVTRDGYDNPVQAEFCNSSSRKRMRIGRESTQVTTDNTKLWNKDGFSSRLRELINQLQGIQGDVRGVINIPVLDSVAASNHRWSTTYFACRRTSSLHQRKMYGRSAEKNFIIKLISEHKSAGGVTVLPIVGIGGIGKTALAQLVYNDPAVENQFDHKIWIWVSNNFDEVRLTREMLDFVSQETHGGLCNLAKLQEILKGNIKSKRILLILDDVWDDKNDCQWNQLLAPFKSDNANNNLILMTTRKPSVAKRRGTAEPIKLGALEKDDFWLLFKAHAFGDENYEEQESLSGIGQKIAHKLKGNPLAAQTAGALLIEHLTVEHWTNGLKNEDWKSLHLSSGIMSSLKFCYDELPFHLQQCFSYCSIFPYGYQFPAEELVYMWISHGFVKLDDSSASLKDTGWYYLTDLVNLGFFEQVISSVRQTSYSISGLMHEFARVVSRTECATIDGIYCNEILPTVHHLSILTDSIYSMDDQMSNIPCSKKFEEKLRSSFTSVKKLRSLVLIGQYDSFFFKAFQEVFQKEHHLRVLHLSATSADFHSFLCSRVNHRHLQYLKLQDSHVELGSSPQVSSKFFNRVLDGWLTSLQTIHLENCGECWIVPSLKRLPSLTRLFLRNMRKVREVSFPSLEELVLVEMSELESCVCTSLGDMNSSLRVLDIRNCHKLKMFDLLEKHHSFKMKKALNSVMLHSCTSLEDLTIRECKSLTALHGMESLRTLRALALYSNSSLELLELKPLTLLEDLEIVHCTSLVPLEGLRSLVNLRHFKVVGSLTGFGESCDGTIFPRLESLTIDMLSRLTTPFCKGLTCLQQLKLYDLKEARLTDEQEKALLQGLRPSLEKLHIVCCDDLEDLPAGLYNLPSLKKLKIECCKGLSRLPKEGLPPSLEQLKVEDCGNKLSKQCRLLATSKLKVKIEEPFLG